MAPSRLDRIVSAPAWLTESERSPPSLRPGDSLRKAVAMFQADTDLRLLPVIDSSGRPRGAIFEKDIRRLLLNPFGHALLQNPSISAELDAFIRTCPMREVSDDIAHLVEQYRREDGREGMILTHGGRLFATISNRRLLLLAAEAESRASAARLARAERIARSGTQFELQASSLSHQMVSLANAVQRLAEATVDRSTIAGTRAAAVASAAGQTRDSMSHVAARGSSLAAAFGQVERSLDASRRMASDTVERVALGAERSRTLLGAARSIDQVVALVGEIAGKVNLLSLNASIEAARAGSAGAGFAVVAGEIRSLSDQTHEATAAIVGSVEDLRNGIEAIAQDYAEIEQAIGIMVASGAEIDRAITAEADTTRLIARTVSEAGSAAVAIEEAIGTIVNSVGFASTSARELDSLANDLRQGAEALNQEVGDFLTVVRAA